MNSDEIEKLSVYPVERVPIPWDRAIAAIMQPLLPAPPPDRMPTEGQAALMLLTLRAWEFGLHWLIRDHWDSKHVMPRRMSIVRIYRPYGNFLYAVRQLAVQCHADAGGMGDPIPFPHAAHWFALIVREVVLDEILRSLIALEHLADERRKKEKVVAHRMQPWRQLERYENPVNQQAQPATWLLFDRAIALAEQGDQWRRLYFKPFCAAAKTWVTETSGKGWDIPSLTDNGRAVVQGGPGRHAAPIDLPERWKKPNRRNVGRERVSGFNTRVVLRRKKTATLLKTEKGVNRDPL
ncbi:MAG: hypothetical protein OHK0037_27660 [Elainellaceae cyanobacterium]